MLPSQPEEGCSQPGPPPSCRPQGQPAMLQRLHAVCRLPPCSMQRRSRTLREVSLTAMQAFRPALLHAEGQPQACCRPAHLHCWDLIGVRHCMLSSLLWRWVNGDGDVVAASGEQLLDRKHVLPAGLPKVHISPVLGTTLLICEGAAPPLHLAASWRVFWAALRMARPHSLQVEALARRTCAELWPYCIHAGICTCSANPGASMLCATSSACSRSARPAHPG